MKKKKKKRIFRDLVMLLCFLFLIFILIKQPYCKECERCPYIYSSYEFHEEQDMTSFYLDYDSVNLRAYIYDDYISFGLSDFKIENKVYELSTSLRLNYTDLRVSDMNCFDNYDIMTDEGMEGIQENCVTEIKMQCDDDRIIHDGNTYFLKFDADAENYFCAMGMDEAGLHRPVCVDNDKPKISDVINNECKKISQEECGEKVIFTHRNNDKYIKTFGDSDSNCILQESKVWCLSQYK